MRLRLVIPIALVGSALAAGAVTARAASERGFFNLPSCVDLLTAREAADAMGEPKALVGGVTEGKTRRCVYAGGAHGSRVGHELVVEWGPYDDFRTSPRTAAGKLDFDSSTADFTEGLRTGHQLCFHPSPDLVPILASTAFLTTLAYR